MTDNNDDGHPIALLGECLSVYSDLHTASLSSNDGFERVTRGWRLPDDVCLLIHLHRFSLIKILS